MPVNRRAYFIRRHVFSNDAARNLAGGIDPFDDPAGSAPGLADGRGDAAAAHLQRTLGQGFMRLFQGAILFRLRGMADPPSLGNTRVALVTGATELFTEHYATMAA
jgi:hypothetical protein